jgi:hypothetical protein
MLSTRRHRKGVAEPLDMVIFEGNEHAASGWNTLPDHMDRLWDRRQCKKYIKQSHIARLWNCQNMDAIRGWMDRWEFPKTQCRIPQVTERYEEVIRYTRENQRLPTCTYTNLAMVYAEVMLGKHVNWITLTAHRRASILRDVLDIPTNVEWNGGLMEQAIANGLLRQGYVGAQEITRSPEVHTSREDRSWDHHYTSAGEQYGDWDSWYPQYTDVRSTWEGTDGAHDYDPYPDARREAVDDTVNEEDFQNVQEEDNRVPQYASIHDNAYNHVEQYPSSPPFRTSGWDGESRLRTRALDDDDNMRRWGGGGESSRDTNRDDQNIYGSHGWEGSTSTENNSRAWNPWSNY